MVGRLERQKKLVERKTLSFMWYGCLWVVHPCIRMRIGEVLMAWIKDIHHLARQGVSLEVC